MYYFLDELTVQPGKLQSFLARYQERYVPAALARGLTLTGTWVTPPVEVDGEPCTVVSMWSIPSEQAFWTQKHTARNDPAVAAWWKEAEGDLSRRERRYLTPTTFSPQR